MESNMESMMNQKAQKKPLILIGINDSHDASACVVVDGKLVCAVSEERPQRVKNQGGFPKNALEQVFTISGIRKGDVDYVCVGNMHVSCENLHNFTPTSTVHDHYEMQEKYWLPSIYEGKEPKLAEVLPNFKSKGTLYYPMDKIPFACNRELDPNIYQRMAALRKTFIAEWFGIPEEKVVFFDHHQCHAYYAYYSNSKRTPGKDFLVLTADGGGDGAYESVNTFVQNKFRCLHKGHENLVAKIYSAVTLMLGMKPHEHEYKVMGLSAYTKEYHKKGPRKVFLDALQVDGIKFKRNPEMKDYFKYFQDRLKGYRFDGVAGGVQDFAEIIMVQWVKNCIEETGIHDVIMAGGVGLNIKVNKRLMELPEVHSLFVPPGAGDESLSAGACYALLDQLDMLAEGKVHIPPLSNAYLGNKATEEEIQELLTHPKIQEEYSVKPHSTPEDVAELLTRGEIVALFVGNMEFGPRALGHRSLICDPSKPDMVRKINDAIKIRDFWMPFTPSILSERINDYILNPKDSNCSYMTLGFDSTELGRKHIPAAIHPYDRTVRPQRVEQHVSPVYYAIIKAFEQKTGVGAVLNTSLNIHGKPIVMKPIHIATELLSNELVELDNIYVDGFLLQKKRM
jgi:carbamoyltransferase